MVLDLLLILGIVSGGVLLIVGLRGRLIDDHPLCARCGFDLTGKPPDSERCAECGADLNGAGSIRIGHRIRRMRPLGAGAAIFLLSALIAGILLLQGLGKFDPQRWKPAWMLSWETVHGDEADRNAALSELTRRLNSDDLTQKWIDAVTAEALRRQGNPSTPWPFGWSSFVSTAFAKGKISNESWTTFARQGIKFTMVVRPIAYPGDPVPLALQFDVQRTGNAGVFLGYTWRELTIDGVSLKNLPLNPGDISYSNRGSSGSYPYLDTDKMTAGLPAGTYPVTAKLHFQVLDCDKGSPLGDFDVVLNSTVSMASVDSKMEFLKTDESQRQAVESAIERPRVTVFQNGGVQVNFGIHSSPTRMTMQASLWTPDGTELRLDGPSIDIPVNAGGAFTFSRLTSKELAGAATVDLILRPDIERMKRSIDMSPSWGDSIVIHNIPVGGPPLISTRPSATIPTR